MGRNFNRYDRFREKRFQNLRDLRSRVRRSPDGKLLGVFKGISDSLHWPCGITRWGGVFVLFSLASFFGVHGAAGHVLGAGFFYLLASMLMGPPRLEGEIPSAASDAAASSDWRARMRQASATASGLYGARYRPPVDLASLDRQLDSLNRRIRRMESVVTDPAYDWERRLGK